MKIFLLGKIDNTTEEDEHLYETTAERLRSEGHTVSFPNEIRFLKELAADEKMQNANSKMEIRVASLLFYCKYISEFDLVIQMSGSLEDKASIFLLWFVIVNNIERKWLDDYEKK